MKHKKRTRTEQGERTCLKILKTGLRLWSKNPESVTALGIANTLKISHATVLYHFPYGVKDAVAEYAVKMGHIQVVAQLITSGHRSVRDMSPSERMIYLKSI